MRGIVAVFSELDSTVEAIAELKKLRVGDVTVYNVDGSVTQGSGMPLLGMSFLSRMEMRNEGQNLTLTKRY